MPLHAQDEHYGNDLGMALAPLRSRSQTFLTLSLWNPEPTIHLRYILDVRYERFVRYAGELESGADDPPSIARGQVHRQHEEGGGAPRVARAGGRPRRADSGPRPPIM